METTILKTGITFLITLTASTSLANWDCTASLDVRGEGIVIGQRAEFPNAESIGFCFRDTFITQDDVVVFVNNGRLHVGLQQMENSIVEFYVNDNFPFMKARMFLTHDHKSGSFDLDCKKL